MSKYGFEADAEPLRLPKKQERQPVEKVSRQDLAKVAVAGRELGFVPREATTTRRSGRRGTEPQGKVLVSGPARVIDAFKSYCDANELTYWGAIEALLAKEMEGEGE